MFCVDIKFYVDVKFCKDVKFFTSGHIFFCRPSLGGHFVRRPSFEWMLSLVLFDLVSLIL